MIVRLGQSAMAAALMLIVSSSVAAQSEPPPNVLVIHSYHAHFSWVDEMIDGIGEGFAAADPRPNVYHEFMDTKRQYDGPDGKLARGFLAYLQNKYSLIPVDLVIVADDNAYQFILSHGQTLFPDTRTVFCGVNHFDPQQLQERRNITGYVESIDRVSTVELALKLHPNTRHLLFITDATATGQGNWATIQAVAERYRDRVSFDFTHEDGLPTMEELTGRLSGLPDDTLVIYVDFFRDGADEFFTPARAMQRITQASPVPVYVSASMYMGHGAVGGFVVDSKELGHLAADRALLLLTGTPVADLPVELTSPNQFMFDDRVLERFEIDRNLLPADSRILNRPYSVYEDLRTVVWTVVGALVILLAMVIGLIVANLRRHRAERQLRQSERRFRSLLAAMPDLVLVTDSQGVYESVYTAQPHMLALPTHQMIGKSIDQVLPRQVATIHEQVSRDAIESGQLQQVEYPLFVEGVQRWFAGRVARLDDPAGAKALWVIRDVTARRDAEQALRDSEERLRLLIENAEDLVMLFDREGRIQYCSGPSRYELDEQSVLGRTLREVLGTNAALRIHDQVLQVGRTGQSLTVENELILHGRSLCFLDHIYPLRDGRGAVTGIGRISRNITTLRQSQRALAESELRYRTLFEDALNPIFIFDEHGVMIDANQAALEFFACRRPQLIGRELWDFAVAEQRESVRMMHTPFVTRRTVEHPCQVNGQVKTMTLSVVPVRSEQRTLVFGIGQDVTERQEAEEAMRESLLELEAVHKVSRAAASGDLRRLADTTVSVVAEMTHASLARLAIREEGELRVIGAYGFDRGDHTELLRCPDRDGLHRPGELSGDPPDDHEAPAAPHLALDRALQVTSRLWWPIHSEGQFIGVLWIGEQHNRPISSDARPHLRAVAEAAAAGIANARAREAEARAARNLRRELNRRSLLLRELNHRVRNNLSTVMALISMTRTEDESAREAMATTCRRIQAMAKVHGLLSRSDWRHVRLSDLVNDICRPSLAGNADGPIQLNVRIEPAETEVTPQQANALALVLQELTWNVTKHAGQARTVSVTAQRTEQGRLSIDFADDNVNGADVLERELKMDEKGGLGIVKGLVEHDLVGDFRVNRHEHGTIIHIQLP